ncbi:MAG: EFR1 family ferrodoxin, partial [Eubacterium sp.]
MTGIFYFSSTGNSLYIAQKIKDELGGRIIYIPHFKGNTEEFDRIIIVSPIYSYGLPVHTYELLKNLTAKSKVYIVLNYGGMVGGADLLTYNLAKEHNINVRAIYTLRMPENFTLTFSTPKFYSDSALKAAPKKIEKIIAAIKADAINIPKNKKTKKKTYYKNKSNWHLIARDFSVTDSCVGC